MVDAWGDVVVGDEEGERGGLWEGGDLGDVLLRGDERERKGSTSEDGASVVEVLVDTGGEDAVTAVGGGIEIWFMVGLRKYSNQRLLAECGCKEENTGIAEELFGLQKWLLMEGMAMAMPVTVYEGRQSVRRA